MGYVGFVHNIVPEPWTGIVNCFQPKMFPIVVIFWNIAVHHGKITTVLKQNEEETYCFCDYTKLATNLHSNLESVKGVLVRVEYWTHQTRRSIY